MGYPTVVNGVSALMTQEDVDAYRELVSTIPAGGTLVEIGSYEGGSLAAVSDIIKAKKIQVVAVDIFDTGRISWPSPDMKAVFDGLLLRFYSNMKKVGLDPTIICGTSRHVAGILNQGIDVAFIDANHVYGAVKEDIELMLPLVKKGGWISGHDYGRGHVGVKQAVDETFKQVKTWKGSCVWAVQK